MAIKLTVEHAQSELKRYRKQMYLAGLWGNPNHNRLETTELVGSMTQFGAGSKGKRFGYCSAGRELNDIEPKLVDIYQDSAQFGQIR